MTARTLSPAEVAALIACHLGGVEGMRVPGVIMVACSTVRSLSKRGAFGPNGLTERWAVIARELSDAAHEGMAS